MENVGTFYGNLEHITAIWYILCTFGNFLWAFVIFLKNPFWYIVKICKIWQPC
jgi:hypothetical protein